MKKPSQYLFKRVLGYGASGTVYEATLRHKPDSHAAVKCIQFRNDARLRKAAKNEADLHVQLQHPFILSFIGADETNEECYLALELCTQGSLHSLLFSSSSPKGYNKDLLCAQLCAAVHYLHEGAFETMAVIHRDIKVENVLVSDDMNIKLADFGAALTKPKNKTGRWGIAGTPGYMSPEMLSDRPYGCATDVWSLGLVLFEIWSGRLWSFGSSDMAVIAKSIQRNLDNVSVIERNILSKFLCFVPEERATAGWALSAPKVMEALGTSFSAVPHTPLNRNRWSTSDSGHATQYNTAINDKSAVTGKYKDMPPFRFL